jgi:hypothetical protein
MKWEWVPTTIGAIIGAFFLIWAFSGCNLDTMNYLFPTYEYQHEGRNPAQEREYLMKEHPNEPWLWTSGH